MANDIHKSNFMAWDGKTQGNMTQAMTKGEVLEDVITIPTDKAITAGDVVWLKNLPSSACLVGGELQRSAPVVTGATPGFTLCLLGLDPITKDPFLFTHKSEDTPILDNLGCLLKDGSADTAKISDNAVLTATDHAKPFVEFPRYICKCDKKMVSGTYQVLNANINKVWRERNHDMTLGMVAEWTMSNQVDNGGVAKGAAQNYDPSSKRGYPEFGIGIVFTALTTVQLEALGLRVVLRYKDSMVSETQYGSNVIPVNVSY